MPTNDELNQFINKTQEVIDRGLDELLETKIIRENDPSDYSYIQHQLYGLIVEADELMKKFPDQHEKLSEVQQKIKEIQDVMVKGIYEE